VTTGTVERVILSHKACNSSVVVSYHDVADHPWRQTFQTCTANHVVGEVIQVAYLRTAPGTAMLRSGEGPYTDDVLRRGQWIGVIVAVFGAMMIVRTILQSVP
jgi:hypothetical protein